MFLPVGVISRANLYNRGAHWHCIMHLPILNCIGHLLSICYERISERPHGLNSVEQPVELKFVPGAFDKYTMALQQNPISCRALWHENSILHLSQQLILG